MGKKWEDFPDNTLFVSRTTMARWCKKGTVAVSEIKGEYITRLVTKNWSPDLVVWRVILPFKHYQNCIKN